jgi:inhibitor of cysteine peptidase
MATVILSEADDGRSVEVHPGDEIVVRLAENPTTGFRWEVDQVEAVAPAGDSFELGEPALVGSGGVRTLTFRVMQEGTGSVELKHWRSWEGDATALGRFRVDVASLP